MTQPAPRKPKLSRELMDALLPSAPSPAPSVAHLPGITIQAAAGSTVTVVVTASAAPKGGD
jgi:hypothetical protein